jgi:RHS repeat-associated protein
MTLPAMGGLPKETLTYAYNAQGLPTTMTGATTYVTATGYTEYGEQNQLTLSAGGKQVYRDFTYETGTRRLVEAATRRDTTATLVSDVSYSYDDAGNILRISDAPDPATGSTTDTQCFTYDSLRRLTGAWTPRSGDCSTAPTASGLGGPAPYRDAWTFDQAGNRTTQTGTAPDGTTTKNTYTYNKPGTAQPHALQGVTTTNSVGTTSNSYAYDPAGNLTQRTRAGVGQSFDWDAEGHLSKVTQNGKTTSYVYDADGDRLISHAPDGTTLYLGDTELHMDNSGGLVGTRYYTYNGQMIAMRNGATGKLSWLVSDQHGTAEIAIDESTQAIQRQRHDPYGNPRGTGTALVAGDRGFVGGVADASTGLTHLGARDYDPTIGRFISVDPQIDYEDPQQMNGYVYANNSPVTFTDPDGTQWVSKTVTSWKTVYRTIIRKIVRTIMVLVTMYVLLFFIVIGGYLWHPIVLQVFKTIVSYIKELTKTLVKITRLIRVWKENHHDSRTAKRLASLAGQLDRLNAVGGEIARAAVGAIMLAQWTLQQIYRAALKQHEHKHKSWWQRFKDTVHSVTQNKWFQWASVAAGVIGLFACTVCMVIGGVGLAMSMASTADSCGHGDGKGCALGAASLAVGGVGKRIGMVGEWVAEDGTWTVRSTRFISHPLMKLGGYGKIAGGKIIMGYGKLIEIHAAGLDVAGAAS